MARKSRKQIAVEEPVIESVSSEVFSTAIYARLSVENSGKSEKVDVIANQIEICKSYIAERPYLNLIDTYVDNGRTGTVFDRPEFNRLMNDIRTGRIKCLVVRDLSRFGRDYIEAGTYLERVFPQIGLRFIAIKENYDNFDADGSGESLIIPLQNMINTLYSKDISRKVSTALKAQMKVESSRSAISRMVIAGMKNTAIWFSMKKPHRLSRRFSNGRLKGCLFLRLQTGLMQ